MKNLENFGVQEMNSNEMKEVNGGFFWFVAAGLGAFWAAMKFL